MPDIDKLSNTERPLPLGPVAEGSQRRRNIRSYKVTPAGTRDEDSPGRDGLAEELASLVGEADFDMSLATDQDSGGPLIRVTDRRSGRLLMEIKPEELLREAPAHPLGLFVNKKG